MLCSFGQHKTPGSHAREKICCRVQLQHYDCIMRQLGGVSISSYANKVLSSGIFTEMAQQRCGNRCEFGMSSTALVLAQADD